MSSSRSSRQSDGTTSGESEALRRRSSRNQGRDGSRGDYSVHSLQSSTRLQESSGDQPWENDDDEEEEEQDFVMPERLQQRYQRADRPSLASVRRSSSQSSSGRPEMRRLSSIPHAPPTLESEGLAHEYYHGDEGSDAGGSIDGEAPIKPENVLGSWHYAPLLIAVLPPLGAVLGGHSDAWSDAILLALATFWLYQFLRVPHDMYHAARTRRVLHVDAMNAEEAAEADAADPTEVGAHEIEMARKRKREKAEAGAELRRAELMSLAALVLSPLAGAWLLTWLTDTFSDGNRYLNKFNIRLFMLASGIRPWTHALGLLRRRILHLQEVVHYPSSRVEGLTRRMVRLESELSTLRKLVATKSDVTLLREGIDAPLTQLSRSMRRYERKEENLRMSAEDKFGFVEARLEDLLREVALNAELIEEERRERARAASLPASIFQALRYALGQRSRSPYDDYGAQRGIGHRTSLGIQGPPEGSGMHHAPLGSNLSQGSSSSMSSSDGLPAYTSPARYPASEATGPGFPPYMHQSLSKSLVRSSAPSSWTEEGMAYWLFWPINIPRSALRTAMSFASNRYTSATDAPYAYGHQQHLITSGNPARNGAQPSSRGAPGSHRSSGSPTSPPGIVMTEKQGPMPHAVLHAQQQPLPTSAYSSSSSSSSQQQQRNGKVPPLMRTGGNGSKTSGSHAPSKGEPLVAGYSRRA